jgi:hypothetical protein
MRVVGQFVVGLMSRTDYKMRGKAVLGTMHLICLSIWIALLVLDKSMASKTITAISGIPFLIVAFLAWRRICS